jgi:hypothetical protein
VDTPPGRRGGPDRRVIWQYRFVNRRTGFDRRKRSPILTTLRDSNWALIALLVLLNLMSLLDGVLTALELWSGVAREGNPIFGNLITAHPALAVGFKVVMMLAVTVIIWHWRAHRVMLLLALATLALYAVVLGYHFGSITGIVG